VTEGLGFRVRIGRPHSSFRTGAGVGLSGPGD